MAGGVDLHVHSTSSDGRAGPAEVARQACSAGLDCIALTDHNVIDGLEPLGKCLDGTGVRLVAGVELTADGDDGAEIHILGYDVDTGSEVLERVLEKIAVLKRRQLACMVAGLRQLGVDISADDLPQKECGYVGRPVLARLLVERGIVRSSSQAFSRYLGAAGSVYAPLGALGPTECVELIHEIGGLAVLAHPRMELLDSWVGRLAEAGLDGLEVYRPRADSAEVFYAETVARDLGMVATGGSDWHGLPAEGPLGSFAVEFEKVAEFFARLEGCASAAREEDGPDARD
ncbi:MAG: PHP domain-containing protein [Candidatus Brocadiia bacterium]|jgi:hypothetical protein|nr:PHP domain-containing protein [Candidatus Brocadiia bacterium]